MARDPIKEALDQLKNTPVAAPQTHTYFGVPNDYQPPDQLQHQQVRRDNYVFDVGVPAKSPSPQYKPGDELKLLQTPELVPQIQAQLVNAGLLNAKSVRPGVWDSSSQSAYKTVLGYANQNGITAQEALQILAGNPKLGSTSTRAANIIQETNPIDIIATAQDSAQKLLGRQFTEAELQPLVAHYQALESGAQKKAYTMGGKDGKGGTVVTPPTVSNAADDYFKKRYGPDVAGYAAVEATNNFYSLLHTPSGPVQ